MSSVRPPEPADHQSPLLIPLVSAESSPRVELPLPLTSFVGRERELSAACAVVRQEGVRLLTLTGPGGVGKTRLAVRVSEELVDDFPEGVWFVPLAPVQDGALVAGTVAGVLGVREVGGRPVIAGLQAFLRPKRALVLLDNFEHLLDAAPLVTDLLSACPHLTVLATSRAPLHVSGEHSLLVPPLALPDLERLPAFDDLSESPAMRLFVERAKAARLDFAFSAADVGAVALICHRLDGLPLAIELAAARCSVLSPSILLGRLEQRLPMLTGGPRDAPARLRTMRDTIAWSHGLLDDEERLLFRRLAAFVGGFTLEAAEEIGGLNEATRSPTVLDGVTSLVEKSLLRPLAGGRFGMLETIREYALEQLVGNGEAEKIWRQHATYYVTLSEKAEPKLRGPAQIDWLDWLETELPNLRAALEWSRKTGEALLGLRLAGALWTFWALRDHVPEGVHWLEVFLEAATGETAERLKGLIVLGDLCQRKGDPTAATAWAEQALALARGLGDRSEEAAAMRVLGRVTLARGEAARHLLGDEDRAEDEFLRAQAFLEQSAALSREIGDTWGVAKSSQWLGLVLAHGRQREQGRALFDEAIVAFRNLGDRGQLCNVLLNAGGLYVESVSVMQMRGELSEALSLAHRLGYQRLAELCQIHMADLAARVDDGERAVRLIGAAAALRATLGEPLPPSMQFLHDSVEAAGRTALGESRFEAVRAEGAALSLESMVAEVVAWTAPIALASRTADVPTNQDGLTQREHAVLRLLAEGQSDREIAAALFVSRRTVASHVAAIFRKLGVHSRAAAAAHAARNGLI